MLLNQSNWKQLDEAHLKGWYRKGHALLSLKQFKDAIDAFKFSLTLVVEEEMRKNIDNAIKDTENQMMTHPNNHNNTLSKEIATKSVNIVSNSEKKHEIQQDTNKEPIKAKSKSSQVKSSFDRGLALYTGIIGPSDEKLAIQLFQESASKKHPRAHHFLGMISIMQENYSDASQHFRKAIELKNKETIQLVQDLESLVGKNWHQMDKDTLKTCMEKFTTTRLLKKYQTGKMESSNAFDQLILWFEIAEMIETLEQFAMEHRPPNMIDIIDNCINLAYSHGFGRGFEKICYLYYLVDVFASTHMDLNSFREMRLKEIKFYDEFQSEHYKSLYSSFDRFLQNVQDGRNSSHSSELKGKYFSVALNIFSEKSMEREIFWETITEISKWIFFEFSEKTIKKVEFTEKGPEVDINKYTSVIRLDLHGMNRKQSEKCIMNHMIQFDQVGSLMIITGRGNHINSNGSSAVLFNWLPTWLKTCPFGSRIREVRTAIGYYEIVLKNFDVPKYSQHLDLKSLKKTFDKVLKPIESSFSVDDCLPYGYHLLMETNDVERGIKFCERAIAGGSLLGMEVLGNYYYDHKEFKKAVKLFIKARNSKSKCKHTRYALSICYYHGLGIHDNVQTAIKMMDEAVELGCVEAAGSLGDIYFWANSKDGVDEDMVKAYKYYKIAGDLGYASAYRKLGQITSMGMGHTKKDLEEGFRWYSKGSECGDRFCIYNLGCYHAGMYGKNRKINLSLAFELFQKAADLGDTDGTFQVGHFLLFGLGCTGNISKAIGYIELAACLHEENACHLLAFVRITQGNYLDAMELLKKSIELKHEPSKLFLKKLERFGGKDWYNKKSRLSTGIDEEITNIFDNYESTQWKEDSIIDLGLTFEKLMVWVELQYWVDKYQEFLIYGQMGIEFKEFLEDLDSFVSILPLVGYGDTFEYSMKLAYLDFLLLVQQQPLSLNLLEIIEKLTSNENVLRIVYQECPGKELVTFVQKCVQGKNDKSVVSRMNAFQIALSIYPKGSFESKVLRKHISEITEWNQKISNSKLYSKKEEILPYPVIVETQEPPKLVQPSIQPLEVLVEGEIKSETQKIEKKYEVSHSESPTSIINCESTLESTEPGWFGWVTSKLGW